jgi:NAD(P)-dependent dehydrogenase (short-subunit alcohol dehydrogenase family)
MDFSGKTIVVTGATKGIGRVTAERLAGFGASIVAMGRDKDDLDSLAEAIGCRTVVADLGDAEAARAAAREAMPADLLVNCAGMTILEPLLDITADSFDRIMAVNTRAPLIVSQEYVRHRLSVGGGGSIVNVSSMSSFIGFRDHAAYCASKGGLDAMSRVMANELGEHGIRVNCVNPIVTLTDMAVLAWSDPAKSAPVLARIPTGRFAESQDVADVIAFLLSDHAAMMNGLAIPVDGGFLVR